MSIISVSLPSDGTTADVADVNTPITTIVTDYNGNITNANIATGAAIATAKLADDAGITGAKLATNAVAAANLSATAITLGYVQITGDFSTSSTTYVQVTGLTLTVTIPAGSRHVKVSAKCGSAYNGTSADGVGLSIWQGTVGSGTQLDASEGISSSANYTLNLTPTSITTPAAGSLTFNVGIKAITGGTAHTNSQTIVPSYLLVEAT